MLLLPSSVSLSRRTFSDVTALEIFLNQQQHSQTYTNKFSLKKISRIRMFKYAYNKLESKAELEAEAGHIFLSKS